MNSLKSFCNKLSILNNSKTVIFSLCQERNFSSLLSLLRVNTSYTQSLLKPNLNLTPHGNEYLQKCGLKVVGKPKLRCKHCYYAGIDGILHVFCSVYPRHKQRALSARKKKYTWILSHACQSKYRPY